VQSLPNDLIVYHSDGRIFLTKDALTRP